MALSLSAVFALSSCATGDGSRKIAEDGQFGQHGGPGDGRGGPPMDNRGPQSPPPGFRNGPQPGQGPQQGSGPGFHGGPQGPGHGFAPVHVNQPVFFHNGPGPGGPGGPGRGGPPQRMWQQHQGWSHWQHPGYVDPQYNFDWMHLQAMTCSAEDAYGIQYPVTKMVLMDHNGRPNPQASRTTPSTLVITNRKITLLVFSRVVARPIQRVIIPVLNS